MMTRFIGIIAAVVCGLLTSNVVGLKFKEEKGYEYNEIVPGPFETDVMLTVNGVSKGETAFFGNKTHIRPYVVHTSEDTNDCLIIFPDTSITKDQRPACTTKTSVSIDKFPGDVKKKCEGKSAYVLREHDCRGSDTSRKVEKQIQKRSCTEVHVSYTFSYEILIILEYIFAYYSDYYDYYIELDFEAYFFTEFTFEYTYCA